MVALTGIECGNRRCSSVQLGLCVCKQVQFVSGACQKALQKPDVVTRLSLLRFFQFSRAQDRSAFSSASYSGMSVFLYHGFEPALPPQGRTRTYNPSVNSRTAHGRLALQTRDLDAQSTDYRVN